MPPTLSLGGTARPGVWLHRFGTGPGARTFNVGCEGASVGVANHTDRNVWELLLAAIALRSTACCANGDLTLRIEDFVLFLCLNGL